MVYWNGAGNRNLSARDVLRALGDCRKIPAAAAATTATQPHLLLLLMTLPGATESSRLQKIQTRLLFESRCWQCYSDIKHTRYLRLASNQVTKMFIRILILNSRDIHVHNTSSPCNMD